MQGGLWGTPASPSLCGALLHLPWLLANPLVALPEDPKLSTPLKRKEVPSPAGNACLMSLQDS